MNYLVFVMKPLTFSQAKFFIKVCRLEEYHEGTVESQYPDEWALKAPCLETSKALVESGLTMVWAHGTTWKEIHLEEGLHLPTIKGMRFYRGKPITPVY